MTLEAQMRQVLVNMIVWLSHGTTANWSPTGAGGVADSRPPTGEAFPPHLYWLKRWERAVERDGEVEQREGGFCERQRQIVLDLATEELNRWRVRPVVKIVEETEGELASRVVKEGRGWSLEQIAMHCRCTVTFARRARLKAGTNVETGVPPTPAPEADHADQRARALELAANGLSQKQIVMLTGLPQTTLRRLLGKAA